MRIHIVANNRVCLFGRTGSGKTTLAKYLLVNSGKRYAVLDPKHTYSDGFAETVDHYEPKVERQVIRVSFDGSEPQHWNNAIESIWGDGERILYVDEATLITPPRVILPSLGKAIRTGRERGLGVWIGSQRPKDIPSAVFTEAEHFFVFQLTYGPDKDKVESFTGERIRRLLDRLRNHDCVYYSVLDDKHAYLRPTIKG